MKIIFTTLCVSYELQLTLHLLFKQDWLKPGGQIMVSEYTHGKNHPNHPDEYIEYIKNRGYQLLTVDEYCKVLTE